MNLYTIKIQQKYWSGKAQNIGAAIKEAARALGFDLSANGLFLSAKKWGKKS